MHHLKYSQRRSTNDETFEGALHRISKIVCSSSQHYNGYPCSMSIKLEEKSQLEIYSDCILMLMLKMLRHNLFKKNNN